VCASVFHPQPKKKKKKRGGKNERENHISMTSFLNGMKSESKIQGSKEFSQIRAQQLRGPHSSGREERAWGLEYVYLGTGFPQVSREAENMLNIFSPE
jgi:hypothetical protein